jgi:hypothetical protein
MSCRSSKEGLDRASRILTAIEGKPQKERFIEAARALGCDEDKERFEAVLTRIVKAKLTREPKQERARKEISRSS